MKERDLLFDNIKGILIFLVVFGHVIQKYIHNTQSYIYIVFVIIYCFHMPLFVFISGFFSKCAEKTQARAFERFLMPYIIWAFIYYLVVTLTHWKHDFSFAVPWFAYWYFQSLFTLGLFLPLLAKIRGNIVILFALALIAGMYPDYGGAFSVSRTICFSGFFILGYYCDKNTIEKIRKNKIPVLIFSLIVFVALILLCFSNHVRSNRGMVEHALWLAEPYRVNRIPNALGILYRFVIFISAFALGSFIIAFTPGSRTIFTPFGRNSLIVFVFHGYFVQLLNDFTVFNAASFSGIAILIVLSIVITIILSLDVFHQAYNRFMSLIKRLIFVQNEL